MLQNRVTPTGNIISTTARGAWLGNRGQLHDAGKTILRPFKHKAWIICQLSFKNRRRVLMSPGLWTELFFLDEATAFSAGHRPCFECRRQEAVRFKKAWTEGNPQFGFHMKTSINRLDEVLQAERIGNQGQKISFRAATKDLPDGSFIMVSGEPYVIMRNKGYLWTPFGYEASDLSLPAVADVLTPPSIVNAFRKGYIPQIALK